MLNRVNLLAAGVLTSLSLLAADAGPAPARSANAASDCRARHDAHPPRACHGRGQVRRAGTHRLHQTDRAQPRRVQPRLQPRRATAPRTPTPRPHGRRVAAFNRSKVPGRLAETPAELTAATTAATIAQVLATPCRNTELTPTEANLELVKAAVMCLINRERAQNGVPPLQTNALLEAAASGHSRELIADNYFAHVSPSGETPVERIRASGYIPDPQVGYVIGENLAWGTSALATPQAIVSAWIASPGHLANILETRYQDTGIGVTAAVPASLGGGAAGATYAQEFGVILH